MPLGEFEPSGRFVHMHLDIIGPLPPSSGHIYVVTMIDGETHWPEAIPTSTITAEKVAEIIVCHWVARFGAPARITTDQGRQFESDLFRRLAECLGTHKIRTTSSHPQANGRVERWHHTMKAAIRAYSSAERWTKILPLILLGLRSAISVDTRVSPAQLTYGMELRLPGEFFAEDGKIEDATDFVGCLSTALKNFAQNSRRHGSSPVYIPAELDSCTHIFLQVLSRSSLEPPYCGPYPVIKRNRKTLVIKRDGHEETISKDCVKPAFLLKEVDQEQPHRIVPPIVRAIPSSESGKLNESKRRQPERRVRFKGRYTK